MKISIVIPAHNEAGSINDTIRQLEQSMLPDYEIIVVNDHSCDNTAEAVRGLAKSFSNVILVDNVDKPGFASALRTGFLSSKGDLIVPVMADLCDDPKTIREMYEKISQGFDVVCGSRYMEGGNKVGGPRLKTFFSRFVGLSLHFLIGIPTRDIANSFKMYKRQVLNSIDSQAKGFDISVELPLKAFFAGFRISEVATTWIDRKSGESKFKAFKQGPNYFRLYLWAIWEKIRICLIKKK